MTNPTDDDDDELPPLLLLPRGLPVQWNSCSHEEPQLQGFPSQVSV